MRATHQFVISFSCKNKRRHHCEQIGASLVISMVLLVVVSMLGISAAQIAIQEEKASRSDRDRQIAFEAAEAALIDAELDIENSPDISKSRSNLFSKNSAVGFPDDGEADCRKGESNIYLGLCGHASENARPVWLTTNLAGDASSTVNSVPYGTFTGKTLQIGKGTLPAKLPRYVIEIMVYNQPGESADQTSYCYRITAIGFGTKDATRVVLQTLYRKEG